MDENNSKLSKKIKISKISNLKFQINQNFFHFTSFFSKRPTLSYCIKRIIWGLVTLFIGVSIVFALVRISTNNNQFIPPVAIREGWSQEQIDKYINLKLSSVGLTGPIINQIFHFWYNLLPFIPKRIPSNTVYDSYGNLISIQYKTVWMYLGFTISANFSYGNDIAGIFAHDIPLTFLFGGLAVIISYVIGVPLGILTVRKYHKFFDSLSTGISLLIYAIPSVILVLIFYIIPSLLFNTSIFYYSGSIWSKFWPELTMVLIFIPVIIILTRRYFADEINKEYVSYARAKGIKENRIFTKHIARNTNVMILRSLPLNLGSAVFGISLITEWQWGIPGIGNDVVKALSIDSFEPLFIISYVTISSFVVIFTSLCADLISAKLDPRIALTKGGSD